MRVIQLARRFARDDWGGTETVIQEMSKRLISRGHVTEVLCTMATAKSREDNFDGLPVRRFPYFYPYFGLREEAKAVLDKKRGSPFSFGLMRALAKYPELDLIHLHVGNRIGGIGRYIARKRKIPYVISLHGGVFDVPKEEAASLAAPSVGALEWGKALGMWVGARRVLQDASAIVCVGKPEWMATQENLPDKKVIYLPNGTDTTRFAMGDGADFRRARNIPSDARVILTVARIDSQKNQLLPLRLLPELLKIDPKTHLLIIGNVTNPVYHQKMLNLVAEQGAKSHVTIIPGIAADSQDIVNAYHAADIFLLPSMHEPFGIVVLEAWSAGLPVIASRVGGIPHFVEDGVDGLLFNPAEGRDFLAAFAKVVKDAEFSRSLAKSGLEKACREYDWEAVAAKLETIYEEAMRDNSMRR